MRQFILISLMTMTVFFAGACQRRYLYGEERGQRVKIEVDWSQFPQKPTGMTLMFFDEDNIRTQIVTNNVDAIEVTLSEGHWRLYVFNQSIQEFSAISFTGMDGYDTALASIDRKYRSSAMSYGLKGETIAVEPEHLGVATAEFYVGDNGVNTVSLQAEDAVMDLDVTVHIAMIQYLNQTTGAISGLSEGYYLTRGHASDGEVTQVLDKWDVHIDDDDPTRGYAHLTSDITTFGLPGVNWMYDDISLRDPESNIFTVSFLLRDRKTVCDYRFSVGNQFSITSTRSKSEGDGKLKMHVSLKLVIGRDANIILPEVPGYVPEDRQSGFDATVDDWESGGNIDLIM